MRPTVYRLSTAFAAAGLAIGALLATHGGHRTADAAEGAQPAAGDFDRQPVLIYDVSGSFLAGTTHVNLIVYSDGLAALSELTDFGGPPAEFNQTQVAFVPADELEQFRIDLGQAGASSLVDGVGVIADIPTTTVTYFRSPGTSVRSNTFSYTGGVNQYAEVQQVISKFLDTYFPEEG